MISHLTTVKATEPSVIAACVSGISLQGAGMSAAIVPPSSMRDRGQWPIQARVAVATVMARPGYRFAAAANGAGAGSAEVAAGAARLGSGQQKKTQHGTRAFRGLEPWSDPA